MVYRTGYTHGVDKVKVLGLSRLDQISVEELLSLL
jgi:hypothetical protein